VRVIREKDAFLERGTVLPRAMGADSVSPPEKQLRGKSILPAQGILGHPRHPISLEKALASTKKKREFL